MKTGPRKEGSFESLKFYNFSLNISRNINISVSCMFVFINFCAICMSVWQCAFVCVFMRLYVDDSKFHLFLSHVVNDFNRVSGSDSTIGKRIAASCGTMGLRTSTPISSRVSQTASMAWRTAWVSATATSCLTSPWVGITYPATTVSPTSANGISFTKSVIIRVRLTLEWSPGASAASDRADDWRNKVLLVHAQHDGVCDCVLYSVRLRPGAKLH